MIYFVFSRKLVVYADLVLVQVICLLIFTTWTRLMVPLRNLSTVLRKCIIKIFWWARNLFIPCYPKYIHTYINWNFYWEWYISCGVHAVINLSYPAFLSSQLCFICIILFDIIMQSNITHPRFLNFFDIEQALGDVVLNHRCAQKQVCHLNWLLLP